MLDWITLAIISPDAHRDD